MQLRFDGEDVVYELISFNKSRNAFEITNGDGKYTLICESPISLTQENESEYLMYILYNEQEGYSENSIFQVFIGNKRIGWIFPFSSLISAEHDYADNQHFASYAYVAYYKLLDRINDLSKQDNEFQNFLYLSDYYNNETILIVKKDNLPDGFDINDYLVGLYGYGFSFEGRGNLYTSSCLNTGKIKIRCLSQYIRSSLPSAGELFRDLSEETREKPQFARFLQYYQFIEMLIDRILVQDLDSFFRSYTTGNSRKLRDYKSRLEGVMSEKTRINRLLNDYSSIPSALKNELKDLCVRFLQKNIPDFSEEKDSDYTHLFYQTRCIIVHSLYLLSNDDKDIEAINNCFLEVLMEILISFSLL